MVLPREGFGSMSLTSASGSLPQERFGVRAIGLSDVGRQRDVNEDAFWVDEQQGVFVVCDGMGGHASGQVASDLAVRTIIHAFKTGEPPPAPEEEPLAGAIRAANHAVFQRAQVDPECRGMGTTAVGFRVEDDILHVCHVGDSRAYRLRAGALEPMTRDHSLINLYADRPELAGQLGPAASNVIIRAVGLDSDVEVDHRNVAMEHGDLYLLCCDGLTDLVDDWMIREIMTSGESIESIANNLIRAANANGGTDNITVVVLAVFEEAAMFSSGDATGTKPGY
jgi:protein phosphatase